MSAVNEFDQVPHSLSDYFVSSEPHRMDLTWVTNTILGTYFGKWRTHDLITESIRNSICWGLYRADGKQVGFARVVTDYCTHSYLCDIVIDPDFRGKKLGEFLCRTVIRDPRIAKTVITIRTQNAARLYAKLGFKLVVDMRKIPEPS